MDLKEQRRRVASARGLTWGDIFSPESTAPSPESNALSSRSPCRLVPARTEIGFWQVMIDDQVVIYPCDKELAEAALLRVQEWREAVWAEDDAK